MRSSKSRSRNKSRNQRSLGNVVNRVFDSSGPEGKVRGTPQQIIEKYLALARDAQLSGDRVAEQSFFQHAEHYTRMLGEAQREQAERQAQFGGGQQGGPSGEDRDERTNGNEWRGESRQDNRDNRDNRQDNRDNRQDNRADNRDNRQDNRRDDNRRDDRQDNRRDESRRDENRRDEPRREDRRDDNRRERAPREPETDTAPGFGAEGDDGLPDFLRAGRAGIPEAVSVDDAAGPVETPEQRAATDTAPPADLPAPATADAPLAADEAADAAPAAEAPADAPRPRRRTTTAAPRRTTARKRGEAASETPAPAEE
ncbi:DUF4167 domain-containing protein [Paracoccus sanguinis]|uniref:DUF4167 domain-containing protein n=1 Tax=Paracoccus sanguinis TaxID=1545044 RepID=UPI001451627E|nr:DUF4167 domain-containing protein [Paracoccus sanguinis]QJD17487.1 DUF4167 domain-containing protein [Paracoccus sanguinis]